MTEKPKALNTHMGGRKVVETVKKTVKKVVKFYTHVCKILH